MESLRSDYLLALETAIAGGSIALFDGPSVIDQAEGPNGISRADELLPNIDRLLRNHNISISDLRQIVVGAGPGSFTGIRIGIATANGLSASMGIPVRLISTQAAVAASSASENFEVVMPIGLNSFCMRSFSKQFGEMSASGEAEVITPAAFLDKLREDDTQAFVVHSSIFGAVPVELRRNLTNCGSQLAAYLGQAAIANRNSDVLKPLFIGKRN